jgi:murein DD-endopeptidase MepM/ murein hydrolase activator NlpD
MTVIALLVALVSLAPATSSDWSWPVGSAADPPTVQARFDEPALPWSRGHRGVDLVAARGTAVSAAGEGVVAFAGALAGRGVVSIVHPGGLRTTYEPVLAEVSIGVVVGQGQVIGTVDRWSVPHAACRVGSCLHWGVRLGDRYIDPLSLLEPPQVRLLPRTSAAPRHRIAVPNASLLE